LKTIALLSSALLFPAYADKVQFSQLPQGVQDRIRAQIGSSAEVNDIDRNVSDGHTTYEVGFKNNGGPQSEMKFDENGNVPGTSTTTAANSTTLDSRKLTRAELPPMVSRVVNSRLAGKEINDIERNVRNGRAIYGIGYKLAGGVGPQQELRLSDNGQILRSTEGLTDLSSVAASSVNSSSVATPSVATTTSSPFPIGLSLTASFPKPCARWPNLT